MSTFSEFSHEELALQLSRWGFKPSHARRILRDYYDRGGETDFARLILPTGLRQQLQPLVDDRACAPVFTQVAEDGTRKLLLRLRDHRTVESVLMPDYRADRAAGCLSSQVGCAMGCDFCATTQSGFERNLAAGEMVDQFLHLRREAQGLGRRLQTLVFMGMGEPMLNLENVIAAVRRIAAPEYGGLGWRQVTVSTVGVIPGIEALAAAQLNVHLALSLHAPDDETRKQLLPAGRRFLVEDVLAAASRFQHRTGRIVTIQYCLLAGVNDSPEQARQLTVLLRERGMHVNLLRYNATGLSLRGIRYTATEPEPAERFLHLLRAGGLVAHLRRPRGRDIDAACGQLRERQLGTSFISPSHESV